MGLLRGAINVVRTNARSNRRDAFVFGLKILKPIAAAVVGSVSLLHVHDVVVGTDYLQTVVYTASLYTFRFRTLVQIAPLVDGFLPGVFRIFGLGALVSLVIWVGAIGIGVKWTLGKLRS
jgi:hypothetical protein